MSGSFGAPVGSWRRAANLTFPLDDKSSLGIYFRYNSDIFDLTSDARDLPR